jgi:hypothetical protein
MAGGSVTLQAHHRFIQQAAKRVSQLIMRVSCSKVHFTCRRHCH